jgi:predicted signal transduction protein with EAL and GGDEF domain/FixJ family two-component response regulator
MTTPAPAPLNPTDLVPREPRSMPALLQDPLWNAQMLERTEKLCRSGSFEIELPSGRLMMSAGLRELVGLQAEQAREGGLEALSWVSPDERAYVAVIWRSAAPDEPFEFEHRLVCADGRRLVVLHRGVVHAMPGGPGRLRGVGMLQDITAQREAEQRLQQAMNHNEVTGLPNRAALLDHLDAAAHAARWNAGCFSVLALEVPRIAEVKASMGFGAGDTLSMALASRLAAACGDGEWVAHLGEGEFALMLEHAARPEPADLRARAEALCVQMDAPVRLGATDVFPSSRVGIARFPDDADEPAVLLERAQTARMGTNAAAPLGFFEPESNAQVVRALQLEAGLRRAVEDPEASGQLQLLYQPQVDMTDGRIRGVEALLRWQDPVLGDVPPSEFLPVAERVGLSGAIGEFVMRRACEQAAAWQRAGLPPLRVCVNLSSAQLQRPDLAAHVQAILRATGANPAGLGLELTEGLAIADMTHASAVLRALRSLGIEIALDDFGTGYSSLGALRSLPIDLVKVDRSFVQDVTSAAHDVSVTRAIITMAHGLQLRVLAEGVETESQLSLLGANACDLIQGRWFSPPVAADEVARMLREGHRLPERFVTRVRRGHTVLLVDDEENILSALKRLLRRDGYHIITAGSAAEGLQRLAETEVDVIVSDQRMPGMSGVEFLRRAKELYPHTVRMVLSGYTELQSIIDAVNEGAIYRFLTKPWDDQHLRAHVAEAVRHKDMVDENRRLARQVETVNADLAAVNARLAQSAAQQRDHADLMALMAGSLRDVLDELPAAVIGIDPEGLVAFVNRKALNSWPEAAGLLGQSAAPLPCMGFTELGEGPCRATAGGLEHRVRVRSLRHGGLEGGRLVMLTPIGEEIL